MFHIEQEKQYYYKTKYIYRFFSTITVLQHSDFR